jgi:exosortase
VVLVWTYWPTLQVVVQRWASDPQYSHGYVIPGFAAVLLWMRRSLLTQSGAGSSAWGFALLIVGAVMRLTGAYLYFDWFDALSLLPSLAGLCLLVGGWGALRWAWPAVTLLLFTIPLPYQVEVALSHPLQRLAARAGAYCLQGLAFPAVVQGNVIVIGKTEIGVVEACSGLSMLMVFVALALAVALLVQRPTWMKAALVTSAVPIAVLANVARITLTGVLTETVGRGAGDVFYHDAAGWLMMPVALFLLWLELGFLSRLFVPAAPPCSEPIGFAATSLGRKSAVASARTAAGGDCGSTTIHGATTGP